MVMKEGSGRSRTSGGKEKEEKKEELERFQLRGDKNDE